jgi:hypothetical protein
LLVLNFKEVFRRVPGLKSNRRPFSEALTEHGEISGSHGGDYEDDLSSETLRRVVWW